MSNLLNIKDQSGNWIPIPVITNGIKSITQNKDYTLTITLNDGTTYTTTSIKGEDGQDYILTEQDKQDIAGLVDTPVDDVQIDGSSIVENGVANVPIADGNTAGVVKINPYYGIGIYNGQLMLNAAQISDIKIANTSTKAVSAVFQHASTFYGLAKASGDTTQSQSDNEVGVYTDEAKASIKNMLGVEDVDIDSKAPVITETVSGDIASFDDGADDMPLQSLVVDIDPVQDLHGYDNPWPAGGGVNKWDEELEIGSFDSHGNPITSSSYMRSKNYIPLIPNATYYFTRPSIIAWVYYYTDTDYIEYVQLGSGVKTFTPLSNATRAKFLVATSTYGTTYNHDIAINYPSTVTSYSPYSNECPISGWTGCEVQRTGKNLLSYPFDTASGTSFGGLTVTYTDDGVITVKGTKTGSGTYTLKKMKLPAGTYTIYTNVELPSGMSLRVYHAATNTTYANARTVAQTFTLTEEVELLVYILIQSILTGDVDITFRPQIELGSTATPYEPYHGETYPITFPASAGTVYGGYVDVINGELVVDRAMPSLDSGTLYKDNGTYKIWMVNNLPRAVNNYGGRAVCNITKLFGYVSSTALETKIQFPYGTNKLLFASIPADFNIADVRVVYELAEPIHYPLAPTEIKTLLGQNNLWADTGDVSVTYRANTELYIDKQIPDVPVQDIQINGTSVVSDGVANVPVGSQSAYGVFKRPSPMQIKNGNVDGTVISTSIQHEATFYGLAKAAGDTTQSSSSNAVGEYTSEAKTAIKQMLDVKDDYDSLVVEVSSTDPVITGKASYRYNCGELYTLSITPPSSGTMDIIFTSGATPTVLTLPETVKMPDWWAGIETNTTYEMCITDGTYCGVMSWAT